MFVVTNNLSQVYSHVSVMLHFMGSHAPHQGQTPGPQQESFSDQSMEILSQA